MNFELIAGLRGNRPHLAANECRRCFRKILSPPAVIASVKHIGPRREAEARVDDDDLCLTPNILYVFLRERRPRGDADDGLSAPASAVCSVSGLVGFGSAIDSSCVGGASDDSVFPGGFSSITSTCPRRNCAFAYPGSDEKICPLRICPYWLWKSTSALTCIVRSPKKRRGMAVYQSRDAASPIT